MPKTKSPKTSVQDAAGFVSLAMLYSPIDHPRPKPKDGGPCHLCTARCCQYFALQIDAPTSEKDYDHIRWYLMHEGIAVWMDEGDWYLEVRTVCRHLQPDNTCGIYDERPQICRDYGLAGGDPCEFFTDDLDYELFFTDDDSFMDWVKKRRRKRKRKR